MSKKQYKNNHFRIDLSNILKRLPLHHQINNSKTALIDFTPAWKEWLGLHLPDSLHDKLFLNSFQDKTLTIRCANPTVASQLKHSQVSLLIHLQSAKINNIEHIKIQIDHSKSNSITKNTYLKKPTEPAQAEYKPLNQEAINNINNCTSTIKNDRLSESLNRLANTLAETHNLEQKK